MAELTLPASLFPPSGLICPHCQRPIPNRPLKITEPFGSTPIDSKKLRVVRCPECQQFTAWINEEQIYPDRPTIPPHEYMPERVKELYIEAQLVAHKSPRSACVLLRIALEILVDDLGAKGKTLNDKIINLNLGESLLAICTACRLVGNRAAHNDTAYPFRPEDSFNLSQTLAKLINALVALLIEPKMLAEEVLSTLETP